MSAGIAEPTIAEPSCSHVGSQEELLSCSPALVDRPEYRYIIVDLAERRVRLGHLKTAARLWSLVRAEGPSRDPRALGRRFAWRFDSEQGVAVVSGACGGLCSWRPRQEVARGRADFFPLNFRPDMAGLGF